MGIKTLARTVQSIISEMSDSRMGYTQGSMQETGKSLFAMDGVQIISSFRAFARTDAERSLGDGKLRMIGLPAPISFFGGRA